MKKSTYIILILIVFLAIVFVASGLFISGKFNFPFQNRPQAEITMQVLMPPIILALIIILVFLFIYKWFAYESEA